MAWKIIAGVKHFVKKCKEDNVSAFAAQSAFFIVLSLIPFIMLFISLVQYTPVTESMVMDMVKRVMPDYISPFLIGIINEMYHKSVGIISAAAVAAVWSAAKGIQYLTNGLNTPTAQAHSVSMAGTCTTSTLCSTWRMVSILMRLCKRNTPRTRAEPCVNWRIAPQSQNL